MLVRAADVWAIAPPPETSVHGSPRGSLAPACAGGRGRSTSSGGVRGPWMRGGALCGKRLRRGCAFAARKWGGGAAASVWAAGAAGESAAW